MAKKVQQPVADGKPENLKGPHPVVAAISQLEFQGNLIPHSWCRSEKLRQPNGKPDSVAMLILADICYWYRATEKRDTSGKVIELRPKFSADMLQKSYKEWAEQFGLTKRQVQDAISFLIERGLIRREIRSFEVRGVMLYNVTFFEPIPAAIRDLTATPLSRESGTPPTRTGDTPHENPGEGGRNNVIPLTRIRDTYTEITTETTPEIRQREGSVCVAGARPAGADTHTLSPAPSAKKKKKTDPVEEFPRLTDEQTVVYRILTTYFPSLGTPASRVEFAHFLQGTAFSPYGAALMCGWLESNERKFPFMKLTLFKQIRDEFNAAHEEDRKTAHYYCDGLLGGEKLKTIHALWSEWEAKEKAAKKGAGAK